MKVTNITDHFSTSSQILVSDVKPLADLGFQTIINNRPDLEGGPNQPLSADIEKEARKLGLTYVALPVTSANITKEIVRKFADVLASSPAPILAFCNSGNRSKTLFQLSLQQLSSL